MKTQLFIICLTAFGCFFLMTRCEQHAIDHDYRLDPATLTEQKQVHAPVSTPSPQLTPNPAILPPQ